MPAQFTIKEADLRVVLQELKQLDPNLRKELQQELRSELKPFASALRDNIPKQSPLSGFDKNNTNSTRYSWQTVTPGIKTPLGKRSKGPGVYPVVSMSFTGRNKSAGFNIMELARQGRSPQGNAMVAALNRKYPVQGGLGRFVIPQAKKGQEQVVRIAKGIIEKFVGKVNRRIR
jgi:hypothetical protein